MIYAQVSRMLAISGHSRINIGSNAMWKFRHRVPEVVCTVCQYEDKWKREHPELYPLDPASVEAWRSFADDLSGSLTLLENKAVLQAEIVNRNSFSHRGFQIDRTMVFELTPDQVLEMFEDNIESKCQRVAEEEYERRELARIKKKHEAILAEMLSESASLDCNWDEI